MFDSSIFMSSAFIHTNIMATRLVWLRGLLRSTCHLSTLSRETSINDHAICILTYKMSMSNSRDSSFDM